MTLLWILVMELIQNTSWDAVIINVGLTWAHPPNPTNYAVHVYMYVKLTLHKQICKKKKTT